MTRFFSQAKKATPIHQIMACHVHQIIEFSGKYHILLSKHNNVQVKRGKLDIPNRNFRSVHIEPEDALGSTGICSDDEEADSSVMGDDDDDDDDDDGDED